MSGTPRVSVIMAAYNAEHFLRMAIESVLYQTESSFELIVVDDDSTDSTAALLDSLSANDERLVVLRNTTNLGPAESRNRALAVSRGEYVAIADADDYCEPTRLRAQVEYLVSHPQIDVVGTRYTVFTEDPEAHVPDPDQDRYYSPEGIRNGRMPLPHPTIMFRRETYERHGGYDPTFDSAEDHELLARWYVGGSRFGLMPEPEYRYRIHPASATSSRARRVVQQSLEVNRRVRQSPVGLSRAGRRYMLTQRAALLIPGALSLRARRR